MIVGVAAFLCRPLQLVMEKCVPALLALAFCDYDDVFGECGAYHCTFEGMVVVTLEERPTALSQQSVVHSCCADAHSGACCTVSIVSSHLKVFPRLHHPAPRGFSAKELAVSVEFSRPQKKFKGKIRPN